jgi:hypothetical protein
VEETFVLVIAMCAVSFVVVPFLGWGISDPGGQWEAVQARRLGSRAAVGELADDAYSKQRVLNLVILVLWVTGLVALFRWAG